MTYTAEGPRMTPVNTFALGANTPRDTRPHGRSRIYSSVNLPQSARMHKVRTLPRLTEPLTPARVCARPDGGGLAPEGRVGRATASPVGVAGRVASMRLAQSTGQLK